MNTRYPNGIPEPRRPGRPRVDEPLSPVTAWLPSSAHDRLIDLAKAKGMPVSAFVRNIIIVRLPRD